MFWSGYDGLYELLRTQKPKATKEGQGRGDVEASMKMGARVDRGALRISVPVARVDGARVRRGRGARWRRRRVVRRAEAISHAPRARRSAEASRGEGARRVDAGSGIVRHERRRRLRGRRGADRAGRGPAGARAVHARGWQRRGIRRGLRSPSACAPASSANDRVFAWDYEARGFSGRTRNNSTDVGGDTLAGQFVGGFKPKITDWPQFSVGVVRLPQRAQGEPHHRLEPLDADGAAHRAPSRPGRHGHVLRVRVVRRRARLRDEDGPGGVSPALPHRSARHRGGEGGGEEGGLGDARRAARAQRAHRRRVAASRTRRATARWWPSSPRSRWTRRPASIA